MLDSLMIDDDFCRQIVLSDNIDSGSCGDFMQKILEIGAYDRKMDAKYKDYVVEPIELVINSFGGSMYDGFGLYGIIEKSYTPIITYAFGSVMSMAVPIFLAGKERYAHKYATFMIHEPASGVWDKLQVMREDLKEGERLRRMFEEIMSEKTKVTKKQLKDVYEKKLDWYISAEEAKTLGIINDII